MYLSRNRIEHGPHVICTVWPPDSFLDSFQKLEGPGDCELWKEGHSCQWRTLFPTLLDVIRLPILGLCSLQCYPFQKKSKYYINITNIYIHKYNKTFICINIYIYNLKIRFKIKIVIFIFINIIVKYSQSLRAQIVVSVRPGFEFLSFLGHIT